MKKNSSLVSDHCVESHFTSPCLKECCWHNTFFHNPHTSSIIAIGKAWFFQFPMIHCTKKWSFSIRISSVNVTISAGSIFCAMITIMNCFYEMVDRRKESSLTYYQLCPFSKVLAMAYPRHFSQSPTADLNYNQSFSQ